MQLRYTAQLCTILFERYIKDGSISRVYCVYLAYKRDILMHIYSPGEVLA